MAILSIQSHVVYGYVGNKAAVFPLQSMGYDVWPIHTVQFSNHTGYGKWQGEIFPREYIRALIKGIEELGVIEQCQAVLSGYMGSEDICFEVQEIVLRLKEKNSQLLYLCDPVIGNTSCFVKPEVLAFFRSHLLADIITPNQFEAATLSGMAINSLADAKQAAEYFHQLGVKIVVITGLKVVDLPPDTLHVFLSQSSACYLIETQEYPFKISPNGTGDLFSALFLGYYLKKHSALLALQYTVYWMEIVMKNTYESDQRELGITSVNYASEPDFLPRVRNLNKTLKNNLGNHYEPSIR